MTAPALQVLPVLSLLVNRIDMRSNRMALLRFRDRALLLSG